MKRTMNHTVARRMSRALAGAARSRVRLCGHGGVRAARNSRGGFRPGGRTRGPIRRRGLIKRGEYLARAGDCIACHTASGGKPFAGGLKFDTPIGGIYSTNITPDPKTGLGGWTVEDFTRAVREGVRKNGDTMYPAMPFPSYARLTDDDMKALYAYFMHGVAPVEHENRAVDIVWPLSMRWPLGIWRKMFAPTPKRRSTAPYTDPVVARGAYLVQAGHCGACHTPRAPTMQERGLTDADGPDFTAARRSTAGCRRACAANRARASARGRKPRSCSS